MAGAIVTRLPFLVVAALIAAALADPVVESIANTGILGGTYADNNHSGIVPALCAGLVLMTELLAMHFVALWRRARQDVRDPLVGVARRFTGHPFADLPLVFAIQIGALFIMESAEQVSAGGTLLGGMIWLGGPLLFSLAIHALFSVACLFALDAIMRAIVHAFAAIIKTAITFIWLAIVRSGGGALASAGREKPRLRARTPHVRRVRGRAPPLVRTAA